MATYNGERFLAQQLKSLVDQTVRPAELVVSDDGSTDRTRAILAEFQEQAPFEVRLLKKTERLGFADNFLHCAEACRHALVAFCDQDDVWRPDKIEMARQRMLADHSLLSIHRLQLTDERLNSVGIFDQSIAADQTFEPLSLTPYKTGWGNTMLFRRALIGLVDRRIRPRQPEAPDRPLSHDSWVYTLAAALGRISHIETSLIHYRQHGSNTMGLQAPKTPPFARIRGFTSTMPRLAERHRFYLAVAECLDAAASDDTFGSAAVRAAAAYRTLAEPLRKRLDIYYSPRLLDRLVAFRRLHAGASSARMSIGSQLKDIGLGVSGAQHRMHREVTLRSSELP